MKLRLILVGPILLTMLCCQMAYGSIVISSVVQTQEVCDLSNGSLTIFATGGNGATLFYSINGGITFQESNIFEDLDSDDYFVTVTDGTVCSQDYTAQVTSAALPFISVDTDCIEGVGLTNIDLVPFPTGIPPYTFEWVGPLGTYTTEDLNSVPGGAYSVLVSDSFGCTVDTSFIVEVCCGFELGCTADTTYLSCIVDYTQYTTDTFLILSHDEKILKLKEVYDIDINALPCSDLEIVINNLVQSDLDCSTPMMVSTTIEVSDTLSSYQCTKTYLIENYLGIEMTKEAEDLTIDCSEDVNTILQNYISENGGAEFTSCSTFNVTTSPSTIDINYNCDGGGSLDIIFLISDDCGNMVSTTATVTVEDITEPTIISCPSDIVIDSGAGLELELTTWLGEVVAEDACSSVTVTNDFDLTNLPSECEEFSTIVQFTVTDDCGNLTNCSASFATSEVGVPIITCPEDLTVECNPNLADDVSVWLAEAEGVDFDNTELVVTNSYSVEDLIAINCSGILEVIFSISNGCEDIFCSATFSTGDTTSPDIDCPVALDVDYDDLDIEAKISDWLTSVKSEDACGSTAFTSDYNPESLMLDCQGSVLAIEFVSTDECGNSNECQSMINVVGGQGGNITCPADLIIDCEEENKEQALTDWVGQAAADDSAGNTIEVSNDIDLQNIDQLACGEDIIVTFQATASCLDLECMSVITIVDNDNPKISCPDEISLDFTSSDFDGGLDQWIASADGIDNCSEVEITNDFDFSSNIEIECGESLEILVVYTALDFCNNEAVCETTLTLIAPEALPTIDCPGPLVLDCLEDLSLVDEWLSSGLGLNGEGGVLELNNDFDPSFLSDLGCGDNVTVIFEVVDVCGSIDCQSNISFIDAEAPTIICPSDLIVSTSNSTPEDEALDWLQSAQASDNCELGEVVSDLDVSFLSNLCEVVEPVMVVFTVNDVCGNVETCEAMLSVSSGAILMDCPSDLDLECSDSEFDSRIASWLAEGQAQTEDGVELGVINDLEIEISGSCDEEIIVLFQSADNCGQSSSCSASIKISDTEAPIMVCPIDLIIVDYENIDSRVQEWLGLVSAEDNCSAVTIISDFDQELLGLECPLDVEVSFDATDVCGNVVSCKSRLSIGEENILTMVCPETVSLGCSELEPDSLINVLANQIIIESSTEYYMEHSYSIDVYDIGCDFIYEFEALVNVYGQCDQAIECRVNISVAPESKVYIPNVFTPSGRTEDYFTIYANPVIEEVEEFYIFDRWGERVFESFFFEPNDRLSGWDGRFKDSVGQSNVFTYYAVLRSVTGEKVIYKGDVTLIK